MFAQVAKKLQQRYPDIRYHISSGNAEHVLEYLDKGLIDFGLLFKEIDPQKYEAIPISVKDTWGVLMRKDSPLAEKETICPEDLWDKPLIVSHQKGDDSYLNQCFSGKNPNCILWLPTICFLTPRWLVEEGLGYALCFDKLINTRGSSLCFRPLSPRLEARGFIVWKKYQVFSKAVNLFLQSLRELLEVKK